MNTAAFDNYAAQPLLPAVARFAIAVAIAAVLAIAWIAAERESHDAVLVAGNAISAGHVTRVTLPMVEIFGRRDAGQIAA